MTERWMTERWMTECRVTVAVGSLVAILTWLVAVTPAAAHASLVASSPAEGQVIGGQVDFLDLVFNEAIVEPNVMLLDPAGGEVAAMAVQPAPNHLRVELDESLSLEGEYTLAYELVSADEDALEVTLNFVYRSDALPQAQIVAEIVDSSGTGVLRWLLVGGLAALVGGLTVRVSVSAVKLRSVRQS